MEQQNLRNFRDFLQIYNKMTEYCFSKCVDNLNSRTLEIEEANCAEDCASKFIKVNNKLMGVYVSVQPLLVEKRLKEAQEQQTSQEKILEEKVQEEPTPSLISEELETIST